jgi:hypothetical protein
LARPSPIQDHLYKIIRRKAGWLLDYVTPPQ